MSSERFRDGPVDPELNPELAQELLKEAGLTMSGVPLSVDPRDELAQAEESARLQRIADSLIPPTVD